jgi:hypothetical protein
VRLKYCDPVHVFTLPEARLVPSSRWSVRKVEGKAPLRLYVGEHKRGSKENRLIDNKSRKTSAIISQNQLRYFFRVKNA